jgi:hypothetical protein
MMGCEHFEQSFALHPVSSGQRLHSVASAVPKADGKQTEAKKTPHAGSGEVSPLLP